MLRTRQSRTSGCHLAQDAFSHCLGHENLYCRRHTHPSGSWRTLFKRRYSAIFTRAPRLTLCSRTHHYPPSALDDERLTRWVRDVAAARHLAHTSPQREADILALGLAVKEANCPPGQRYLYNNTNFVLLAEIIRRVTGMDADAFRREAIYEPLGMRSTGAWASDDHAMPHLATGYIASGLGQFVRGVHLLGIAGDVVTSCLDDMVTWVNTLRSGVLGEVSITESMARRTVVSNGDEVWCGLGLAVRDYRGRRLYCHTGSQPGYKTHIAYMPARDFGMVLLSNREEIGPTVCCVELMESLYQGEFPRLHPCATTSTQLQNSGLTSRQLECLDGTYIDAVAGEMITIRLQNGILHGDMLGVPLVLYPVGSGCFASGDDYQVEQPATLTFATDNSCENVTCKAVIGGFTGHFVKVVAPALDQTALQAYVGRYENAQLGSVHTITLETDDQLYIQYGAGFDGARKFPMQPVGRDDFLVRPTAPGIAYQHLFRFSRDAQDSIIGVAVSMERLKRFWLTRQPERVAASSTPV
ncbi:hypothetical protein C2W62_26625 [Candidatus Entotheonella serta]|nr:hypothetical protein C2W62_26625 [Candidatus Entotheonella serta]